LVFATNIQIFRQMAQKKINQISFSILIHANIADKSHGFAQQQIEQATA
jgi:hypothetical protein